MHSAAQPTPSSIQLAWRSRCLRNGSCKLCAALDADCIIYTAYTGYATLETVQQPSTAEAVQRPQRFPPLREHVHGVLYKLSKDDLRRLSEKEGGYKLQEVEVGGYGGYDRDSNQLDTCDTHYCSTESTCLQQEASLTMEWWCSAHTYQHNTGGCVKLCKAI